MMASVLSPIPVTPDRTAPSGRPDSRASGQSTVSLTRRPATRSRSRTLTSSPQAAHFSSTRPATADAQPPMPSSPLPVSNPSRPPKSPLRGSTMPPPVDYYSQMQSQSQQIVAQEAQRQRALEEADEPRIGRSRREDKESKARKRCSSVPREYRFSITSSHLSDSTLPLFPAHANTHPMPAYNSIFLPRDRARESMLTDQSGASSSLYPLSTSTASAASATTTDWPPSPPSDYDRHFHSNQYVSVHDDEHDDGLLAFKTDDVAYRLRLLVNNNYFLPPAHSKPSPLDLSPRLNAERKPAKQPGFFDIFRVGKSKSKPTTPDGVAPAEQRPVLRTTSDSTTASGWIAPNSSQPVRSQPIPRLPPAAPQDRAGRVAVVREKVDDLEAAVQQAEEDMKRAAQEARPAAPLDEVIDPTDVVDVPMPSADSPFAVQTSAVHGLGIEQSVGAAVLADRLPPKHSDSSGGLWAVDSAEEKWRKQLLQDAVNHSLSPSDASGSVKSNLSPTPSPTNPNPNPLTRISSEPTPARSSTASAPETRTTNIVGVGQPILTPESFARETTRSPQPQPHTTTHPPQLSPQIQPTTRRFLSERAPPALSLPQRAETPGIPPTGLSPAPRTKVLGSPSSQAELRVSEDTDADAPAVAHQLRKAVSSPLLHSAYGGAGPPQRARGQQQSASRRPATGTGTGTSQSQSQSIPCPPPTTTTRPHPLLMGRLTPVSGGGGGPGTSSSNLPSALPHSHSGRTSSSSMSEDDHRPLPHSHPHSHSHTSHNENDSSYDHRNGNGNGRNGNGRNGNDNGNGNPRPSFAFSAPSRSQSESESEDWAQPSPTASAFQDALHELLPRAGGSGSVSGSVSGEFRRSASAGAAVGSVRGSEEGMGRQQPVVNIASASASASSFRTAEGGEAAPLPPPRSSSTFGVKYGLSPMPPVRLAPSTNTNTSNTNRPGSSHSLPPSQSHSQSHSQSPYRRIQAASSVTSLPSLSEHGQSRSNSRYHSALDLDLGSGLDRAVGEGVDEDLTETEGEGDGIGEGHGVKLDIRAPDPTTPDFPDSTGFSTSLSAREFPISAGPSSSSTAARRNNNNINTAASLSSLRIPSPSSLHHPHLHALRSAPPIPAPAPLNSPLDFFDYIQTHPDVMDDLDSLDDGSEEDDEDEESESMDDGASWIGRSDGEVGRERREYSRSRAVTLTQRQISGPQQQQALNMWPSHAVPGGGRGGARPTTSSSANAASSGSGSGLGLGRPPLMSSLLALQTRNHSSPNVSTHSLGSGLGIGIGIGNNTPDKRRPSESSSLRPSALASHSQSHTHIASLVAAEKKKPVSNVPHKGQYFSGSGVGLGGNGKGMGKGKGRAKKKGEGVSNLDFLQRPATPEDGTGADDVGGVGGGGGELMAMASPSGYVPGYGYMARTGPGSPGLGPGPGVSGGVGRRTSMESARSGASGSGAGKRESLLRLDGMLLRHMEAERSRMKGITEGLKAEGQGRKGGR